jgi:hypothetical protein
MITATSTERVAGNKFDLYYLECDCGQVWNQVHTPPGVEFKCLRCGNTREAVEVAQQYWRGCSNEN